MGAALVVAVKDVRLMLRDPQTLVIQILMPLILAVMIGFAMDGMLDGEGRLRVAAIDLDRSEASAAFIENLDRQEAIALQPQRWERPEVTEDDAASLLDSGKRLGVLVVPAGFGESLDGGEPTEVRLYTDPAQRQFVRSMAAVVNGELQRGAFTLAAIDVGAQGGLDRGEVLEQLSVSMADPLVSLREEALTKGTSLPSGFDQTIPGFTVMFAMFMATFVVIHVARERNDFGTAKRVLLTPAPRPALLVGRTVAAYALGAVQMVVLFFVGWLAFGIELGNAGGLAIAVAVFVFVPVAIGVFFSTFSGSLLLMVSLANLMVIVLGAIGGSLVPVFFLPRWMEVLASFTPHYWALQAFQDLMFRGASLADLWLNLGILAAFSAVFFALGLARFSFAK
jgi:ABC-2 type transport system permease protein